MDGYTYLVKNESKQSGERVGELSAFRLLELYYNTERNLTTENFFMILSR